MTLGENIKKYRLVQKLTQAQLADMLGLSTITIRQYESNKREPNFDRLSQIAKQLHVSIYDLIPKEIQLAEYERQLDAHIFNTVNTFFLLDNYILEENSDSTYSLYETTDHNAGKKLILSNLTNYDLEEIESWIGPYIKQVIKCISNIKSDPNYILQPEDPPSYLANTSISKKEIKEFFEEYEELLENFKDRPEYDRMKKQFERQKDNLSNENLMSEYPKTPSED